MIFFYYLSDKKQIPEVHSYPVMSGIEDGKVVHRNPSYKCFEEACGLHDQYDKNDSFKYEKG